MSHEEEIIECVRRHQCLYNTKSEDYKNATLKQESWEQIGDELNIPASECKIKWNLLRNAFLHAVSRRKTVTGQGVKNFKKWKFEDEMSFLLPFIAHRATVSNLGDSEQENSNSSAIEMDENENINVTQRKRKMNTNNYQEEILNVIKGRNQKTEKDEIDLFFQMVAKTVKNFPKVEQVELKFNIMKLVNEIEIRCLDSLSESSGSPSRMSSVSTPSPPPFIRRTSSYFRVQSPTHLPLRSQATHQNCTPQYVQQASPSPQTNLKSSSPISQRFYSYQYGQQSSPSPQNHQLSFSPVSSPQCLPQSTPSPETDHQQSFSESVPQSPSPQTHQPSFSPFSSTQCLPQSTPSPQTDNQPSFSQSVPQSPSTQTHQPSISPIPTPQYVPQSTPLPLIDQQPSFSQHVSQSTPSSQTHQPLISPVSSPQDVPQSSPSTQTVQQTSFPVTQQVFFRQYVPQPYSPAVSQHFSSYHKYNSPCNALPTAQDSVVELSIPNYEDEETRDIDDITPSQQSRTYDEERAKAQLKEFLILKKR